MTRDRPSHPLSEPTRELRRLSHAMSVATTYTNYERPMEVIVTDRAAAEREGYDEGYERGLAESQAAIEQLRRELDERMRGWDALLNKAASELRDARLALNDEFERHVPELVLALVTEILGYELRLSDNPGRDALQRALKSSDDVQSATVRLNPSDFENLGDVGDVTKGRAFTFVADEAIEVGGVLVETGHTTLDGRITAALERVREVLIGAVATEDDR